MPFDATPKSNVLDVLRDARELIQDPEKWCRYSMYLPKKGQHCARGAVARTLGMVRESGTIPGYAGCKYWEEESKRELFMEADCALGDAASTLNPDFTNAADLNNESTHSQVMQMFDLAIEREAAKVLA